MMALTGYPTNYSSLGDSHSGCGVHDGRGVHRVRGDEGGDGGDDGGGDHDGYGGGPGVHDGHGNGRGRGIHTPVTITDTVYSSLYTSSNSTTVLQTN